MKSIKFSIDNIATIKIAYSSKSKLFAIIKIFPNFGSTGNLANNFPISVIVVLSFLFSKSSLSSSICELLSIFLLSLSLLSLLSKFKSLIESFSLIIFFLFILFSISLSLLFFSIVIILFNLFIFSISGISTAPILTKCSKDLSIKYNLGFVIKGKV